MCFASYLATNSLLIDAKFEKMRVTKTKIAAKKMLTSKLSPSSVSSIPKRIFTKKPVTKILMLKFFFMMPFSAPIMLSKAATIAIAEYLASSYGITGAQSPKCYS